LVVVNQVIKGVSGVPGKKWNPEKPYGMTLVLVVLYYG
jgi:hypothetical protein